MELREAIEVIKTWKAYLESNSRDGELKIVDALDVVLNKIKESEE